MKAKSKRSNGESLQMIIISVIFFVVAAIMLIAVVMQPLIYSYDNTTKKTYTFKSAKRLNDGYDVYVTEEITPLRINNFSKRYADKDAIAAIAEGEQIVCYVTEGDKGYEYNIVELSVEGGKILSVEGTNKAYKENRRDGIIVCSILLGIAIAGLVIGIVTQHNTYVHNGSFLAKQLIKRQMKKENCTKEEIAAALKEWDEFNSLELPCPQAELEKTFMASIYSENGIEYTSADDYLKNMGCSLVFNEFLYEKLGENELHVYHSVPEKEHEDVNAVFVAYKYRGKLLRDYAEKEENHKYAALSMSESWDYPTAKPMKKGEIKIFREALKEYNRTIEDIFDLTDET